MSRGRSVKARWLAALCLLLSCSLRHPHAGAHHHHHHGPGGPPTAPAKPPEQVTLVKMISWAEPAPSSCDTDLEGSAPPASFRLRYTEAGEPPASIENDPEKLFGAGWGVITRSARGLGFEKAGAFRALDFDIVEELQCKCEPGRGKVWKHNALVNVKLDWTPGSAPSVTARLKDADRSEEIRPVTINGQLAMYEFRFARPYPGKHGGECASRFLVALGLDQPIE